MSQIYAKMLTDGNGDLIPQLYDPETGSFVALNAAQNSDATIDSGANKSDSVYIGCGKHFVLYMSSGWDAADVAFEASPDGDNWYPLKDDTGSRITATVSADDAVSVDLGALALAPVNYVKLASVSTSDSSTAVNQTAERVITIGFKG